MRMTILAVLLLAGCAANVVTPNDLMSREPTAAVVSGNSSQVTLQCVRNELLNEKDWQGCLAPLPEIVQTEGGADLMIRVPIIGTVGILSAKDGDHGSTVNIFAATTREEWGPLHVSCERVIRYERAIRKCG